MSIESSPVVGSWYRRLDRPQAFHVVACDPAADTIDIEYFDGTVDEWPLSHWYLLDIEPCDAPQDWTGPFDNIERDDLGESGSEVASEDWQQSLPEAESAIDTEAFEESLQAPPRAAVRTRRSGPAPKTRR